MSVIIPLAVDLPRVLLILIVKRAAVQCGRDGSPASTRGRGN